MVEMFIESPEALFDQIKLSTLNVIGQMFIYLTLSWLGPINLILITTTRKVFSLVVSIMIHGHFVNLGRATGMVCVTVALLLFTWEGYQEKLRKDMDRKKVK